MKHISVVALAFVSSAAVAVLLFQPPAPRIVFAASAAPAQQPAQGQPPNKGIVLQDNGKPLTPAQQLQVQLAGFQLEIETLQSQLRTDENTIHTLQSSLTTLQTQFANHSHKVTTFVPGHFCTGLNQYVVTQAGTGKQVTVGLETVQACSEPNWQGSTPSVWASLNVSTPVQGAQTPQQ